MKVNVSKSNDDDGLEFFNSRLDEVRMSGHERLKAKAQLARAEAVASLFFTVLGGIGRAFRAVGRAGRPSDARRTATHAG